VETIVSYLIRADDSSVLTDAELRRMLTTEEFAAVRRRLETEFIDDLRNAFWNWEMNYQRDYGSPDDYIRPFSEVLDAVAAELHESKAVQDACAEARGWVIAHPDSSADSCCHVVRCRSTELSDGAARGDAEPDLS
jgi:hypothetical protein